MPPKLENIFKRKTPAAVVDIPIPDELSKAVIPNSTDLKQLIEESKSKKNNIKPEKAINEITSEITKRYGDFKKTIEGKKCSLYYNEMGKNYLTIRGQSEDVIVLYVKLVDGNGTPFYLNMETYGQNIEIPTDNFDGPMVAISNNKVKPEQIKYLIASNKNNNQLIECGDNKFCVVKNNDSGENKVDIYEIPPKEDLEAIKKDIDATQTSKPAGSKNIEGNVLISYRIESYDRFVLMDEKVLKSENLSYYNRQFEILNATAKGNMQNTKLSYKDIEVLINSFEKNYNLAVEKTMKVRERIISKEPNENTKRDNGKKINETIENYIRQVNLYNEEFVNLQKTVKKFLKCNNDLVDEFNNISSF